MMGLSKRVYGIAAFFVMFSGAVLAGAATGNVDSTKTQKNVTVKTMSGITINSDGDATSTFDGISADAAAAGLDRVILHGAVSSKKLEDGSNRVVINWHTLENQRLGNSTRQPLESPLHSAVRVNGEEIPPQTRMTANGNIDSIIESFNTIIERENSQGETDKPAEEEADKQSLADSGSADRLDTGSPMGGDSALDEQDDLGPNTNLLSERQELCDFRVDIPGLKMYKQIRTDTVDENGQVTKTGDCADTGKAITLEKKYGGDCSVTADPENMVAYQSYRVVSMLDGITQILQDCRIDTESNTLAIKATTSDCGVTHDFSNGVTRQQERLYYLDSTGNEVKVGSCKDSDTEYEQFVTTASCEPIVDLPNNLVIPQQRVAYKAGNGSTEYATDCAAASGTAGIAIQTEVCQSPKFEHDFTNGQSYVRKRQYYNDYNNEGAKKYLTSCGRSQESYAHLQFTESCSVKHDDENMRTEIMAVTAIDTPEDGQVEISPCAVVDTSSYIYNGYEMELYKKYPSRVKQVNTSSGGGMSYQIHASYRWDTGVSTLVAGSPFTYCEPLNKVGTFYCNRTRWQNAAKKDYIRYDGSHFYKWDTSIIEEKKATN